MNRWIVPVLVATAVAATVVAATALPPQQHTTGPSAVDSARVSLLCPSFRAATASVRVAAASTGEGLRTSRVSAPAMADEATGVAVLTDVVESVRVSAPRLDTFGAVTVAESSAGPERGLSAATCQAPRTEHWFTGVDASKESQADLVLANLDATEAAVDITVLSDQGRLVAPGSRGIVVTGNSQRVVSLGPVVDSSAPVTLLVETSEGRVAAHVRQRWWRGDTTVGADWISAGAAPVTDIVVPGIPQGPGARDLVVANPGERIASVRIEVLGTAGRSAIAGFETIDLPAHTTRQVSLANGLAEQAGALRLVSSQPVTASMRISTAGNEARRDLAVLPAATPLDADGLWPIPISEAAESVLALSNAGEQEATVTLTAGNSLGGPGRVTDVAVIAGGTVLVPVAPAEVPVLRLQTGSGAIHAALVATKSLGQVRGIAVVTMGSGQAPPQAPEIRFDPHAGS